METSAAGEKPLTIDDCGLVGNRRFGAAFLVGGDDVKLDVPCFNGSSIMTRGVLAEMNSAHR